MTVMTEQQWMKTLSPTERCFPRAVSRHRAIYEGWISTMPREPSDDQYEGTRKQLEEQKRRDLERAKENAEDTKDYFQKVW